MHAESVEASGSIADLSVNSMPAPAVEVDGWLSTQKNVDRLLHVYEVFGLSNLCLAM